MGDETEKDLIRMLRDMDKIWDIFEDQHLYSQFWIDYANGEPLSSEWEAKEE